MKILGRTKGGYIAEVSDDDIAAILGERWLRSEDQAARLVRVGLASAMIRGDRLLPIGTVIPLQQRFDRVCAIEDKRTAWPDTVRTLRTMADLLEQLGTDIVLPPKTEG